MRLLKPSWVSHDGKPIFSIDIHPDGSRFATGGQGEDSGRVVVWNMAPVRNEEDEKDDNVPRILCQMDNHLACVNCVRWSGNGKYLASGGDDKLIMIWQTGNYKYPIGSINNMNSAVKLMEVEQWRCVRTLRGHSGDVLDLAWSPHDAWLASCSIDNTVVIWNADKFPDIIAVLRGHTGLVKGVTWDPVGKYLASQSDDKSLRIWRTLDWQQEKMFTESFEECGGTTHVLRLNWSPDGQYLVSAHAMNNSGPTAQIVEREGWKTNKDYVGHRKAITVVKFNPNILTKVNKENNKIQPHCCCAIGSRDRSLSIWLTSLKRPLVVIHDLFSNSLLDISWSKEGHQVLACSWDGTIAFIDFTDDEIGTPLSLEEKHIFHQRMYGKSLSMLNNNTSNIVIENPYMLKLQQQKELEEAEQKNKQITKMPPPINRGPSKQIETRTADGRRRITPLFLASTPEFGDIPDPFSGRTQPTFSSSSESKSKIVIEKRDEVVNPSSTTQPTISHTADNTTKTANEINHATINVNVSSMPSPIERNDKSKQNSSMVVSSTIGRPPDKPKDKLKTTTTTCVPIKRKVDVAPLQQVKRSRPVGRPPLNPPLTPIMMDKDANNKVYSSSVLHLPVPALEKSLSLQLSARKGTEKGVSIELDNEVKMIAGLTLSRLKCEKGSNTAWETMLTSKGLALAGNKFIICVACEDKTISIFSSCGRRLAPPIVLAAQITMLQCNGYFVMAIISSGHIFVWNMQKHCSFVNNESLSPIMAEADAISSALLSEVGIPVISLNNGKAFCFDPNMRCWMLLANSESVLQLCSNYQSCITSKNCLQASGPLLTLQRQTHRSGHQVNHMYHTNHNLQQVSTMSHLENQLAAAISLNSNKEYRYWLEIYIRYLTQENLDGKIREVCEELLGPVFSSSSSLWDPLIIDLPKRDLLKEMLPVIGSNLRFQRLFTEFQEQLEHFTAKSVPQNTVKK